MSMKFVRILSGLVLIAIMFTACAAPATPEPAQPAAPTNGPPTEVSSAAAETESPMESTAVEGPKYGGTLVIAMTYEPKFYNVNYDFDGGAPYLNMNIYSKLIAYDYVTNELHADLAESWEASADATEFTFNLRQGVKWHDGEPFSAADVLWTVEDIIKEGDNSVAYKFLKDVATIEATDDYTVVFKLSQPNSTFLSGVASYYGFNILPKHLYEGTDVRENEYNFKPVGTGPFKFVEHVTGSHAEFEANTDYWGPGPYLDKLIFRFIKNLPTAMAALESGEVGYSIASPPFGDVPRLEESADLVVDPSPSAIVHWFGFNITDRPEFQDMNVRRAVAHAINVDEVASNLYLDYVKPSHSVYTSVVGWANNSDALQPEFDPAKAEQLLDEAGYPRGADGIRFKVKYVAFIASIWGGQEIAQMVKQYLGDVGIEVEVEVVEFAVFTEKIRNKRDFDLVGSGGLRGPDPNEFVNFVSSNGTRNVMGWSNARVDELFELARLTADQDKRKAYYYEIQEIVAAEMPMVNVVEYSYMRPSRAEYTGFWWQDVAKGTLGQDMYSLVQWSGGTPR